jgi:hypothetical protein
MPPKATMRNVDQTVGATPSETVINEAMAIKYCNDVKGRRIGIQKPSTVARYRILKMLGPDNARNDPVVGHAMLACCVRELDGQKMAPPNSERQIEVILERLGDEGLAAVSQCLVDEFGVAAPADDEPVAE